MDRKIRRCYNSGVNVPSDRQRLAYDLVKSANWEWKEGMLLLWGVENSNFHRLTKDFLWEVHALCGGIPDLYDEQTLRLILEIVREKRSEPEWIPRELYHDSIPDWVIESPSKKRQTLYNSYVSALVAALLRGKT
jgi:hypothetical protein